MVEPMGVGLLSAGVSRPHRAQCRWLRDSRAVRVAQLAAYFDRVHRGDLEYGNELLEASGVVEPRLVPGELVVAERTGEDLQWTVSECAAH